MKIMPDCTDLYGAVSAAVTTKSMSGLARSTFGQMASAVTSGATFQGEALTLHFTRHTLSTTAHTLAKNGVCTEAQATALLATVVTTLVEAGLATVDSTEENYIALQKKCLRYGYCDGDAEDAAVLAGALRLTRTGERVVLTTEDGGMHHYARQDHVEVAYAATMVDRFVCAS